MCLFRKFLKVCHIILKNGCGERQYAVYINSQCGHEFLREKQYWSNDSRYYMKLKLCEVGNFYFVISVKFVCGVWQFLLNFKKGEEGVNVLNDQHAAFIFPQFGHDYLSEEQY